VPSKEIGGILERELKKGKIRAFSDPYDLRWLLRLRGWLALALPQHRDCGNDNDAQYYDYH
jgi:hypothetical protein